MWTEALGSLQALATRLVGLEPQSCSRRLPLWCSEHTGREAEGVEVCGIGLLGGGVQGVVGPVWGSTQSHTLSCEREVGSWVPGSSRPSCQEREGSVSCHEPACATASRGEAEGRQRARDSSPACTCEETEVGSRRTWLQPRCPPPGDPPRKGCLGKRVLTLRLGVLRPC